MPSKGNAMLLPEDNLTLAAAAAAAAAAVASPSAAASARKDMDHLVQELKENLKLERVAAAVKAVPSCSGGGGKMSGGHHYRRVRASPYGAVPPPPSSRVSLVPSPSSICDSNANAKEDDKEAKKPSQLRRWNQRRRYPSTCMPGGGGGKADPDDPFQVLQELISDGSLVKEAVRRLQLGLSPKFAAPSSPLAAQKPARVFYDSDDECRTPPAYPDLLCGGVDEVAPRVEI